MIRLACILLFFSVYSIKAQEQLSALETNPIIIDSENLPNKLKSSLSIPFQDDFSYSSYFPDNLLWQDFDVFINRTYAIDPVTLGVATFDGLDSSGFAYDLSQNFSWGEADRLTSNPIDISILDTVFLLFYYQPQGIGDAPQYQDSLVLQFLDDSFTWSTVWSTAGKPLQQFKKKILIIDEDKYLHQDFQFRFKNYATLSGNYDHWHIDYVKLDEYINSSDTGMLNDVAFVYSHPPFLKRYREMPWTHFKDNMEDELKDTLDIRINNFDITQTDNGVILDSASIDYSYKVYENQSLVHYFPGPNINSVRNYDVPLYNINGSYSPFPHIRIEDDIFLSNSFDSASFFIQQVMKTNPDMNKQNDTLTHIQNFYSHFAYDDGTAESAYGINSTGSMGAMQFTLNRPDTLRAVQIYFPHMLNVVNNIDFYLTVWDDNSGQPGNIIYQEKEQPVHTSKHKFQHYYIDSLFQLTGTFYVGWEQITNDLLNIGLDRNNPANDYMFYNIGSGWSYSQFPGSWMIRPILSQYELTLSIPDIINEMNIFPNPFIHVTNIVFSKQAERIIQLFDIHGNLLVSMQRTDRVVHLYSGDLASGMYFLCVTSSDGVISSRLIIQ